MSPFARPLFHASPLLHASHTRSGTPGLEHALQEVPPTGYRISFRDVASRRFRFPHRCPVLGPLQLLHVLIPARQIRTTVVI